jgi:hypothetical protein
LQMRVRSIRPPAGTEYSQFSHFERFFRVITALVNLSPRTRCATARLRAGDKHRLVPARNSALKRCVKIKSNCCVTYLGPNPQRARAHLWCRARQKPCI